MDKFIIEDRYSITKEIDSGGFSKVYLAFDKFNYKNVAIKVLNATTDDKNKKQFLQFRQEAMTMAAITSPNIVKVYGTGVHEDHPYIIMEYVKGKNLREIINENGTLIIEEFYHYTLKIIDALEICHNAKIIHRDIKPVNVKVKPDGTVILLDFGTAFIKDDTKNLYELEQDKFTCTIYYMAPEFVKNPKGTIQTDIYALGITMFEMLTGKVPFNYVGDEAKRKKEIYKMHLETPFPSLRSYNPTIPIYFEELINKCCAKKPEDRYQNMNELRIALMQAYNQYELNKNKPVETKKESFFKRLFKGERK